MQISSKGGIPVEMKSSRYPEDEFLLNHLTVNGTSKRSVICPLVTGFKLMHFFGEVTTKSF